MGDTTLLSNITLVIPQHGRAELTLQCVGTLLEHHPHVGRVLVVDDGSPASELRRLASGRLANTEIVRLQQPHGVTGAWNAGLRHAATDAVVLLNNDTITTGPWIDRLAAPLFLEKQAPLLTGVAARCEPLLPLEVNLVEGWCLALRTNVLRSLGGFDPRFRLYFSDTDLQLRLLHRSGSAICCVGNLPVRHLAHATARQNPRRRQIWTADRERFMNKWPEATALAVEH